MSKLRDRRARPRDDRFDYNNFNAPTIIKVQIIPSGDIPAGAVTEDRFNQVLRLKDTRKG